jgi:hypothetical protein
MNFYFFNYIVAGRSTRLEIPPPPEWMGSRQHNRPVANNIAKKSVKGCGKNPCPSHFLPHYLTNEFLFFQLHHCRAVHTIGDISTPRMNGKLVTPLPCCQQHYKEGGKWASTKPCPPHFLPHYLTNEFLFFNYIIAGWSTQLGRSPPPEWMGIRRHHHPVANNITKKTVKGHGKKPCPPHFLPHYLTNEFSFFQITSLQGGLHNWGYLRPQNEWEAGEPLPCLQQHYQEGSKRARCKTMPSTFSTPLSH